MYAREMGDCDSKTRCTLSHAVIHLLVPCKLAHIKAHTQKLVLPHTPAYLASQEAMGPVGQRGESERERESLVHLFRSNYRNRTISATTAAAFFIFLEEREGGKKGEKTKL